MNKKIVGILVCTLLIATIIYPVNGQITESLNINKNCNEITNNRIVKEQNIQPLNVLLDEYIESQMSSSHIPGLSATIVKNNNIFWTKSYGYANISKGQLVENTTLFYLASVTKTITATAIMQLYEDGHFDLNDSINDYLPFEVNHPLYSTKITFQMLMTHTSSIMDNPNYINYTDGDPTIPLGKFLKEYLTIGGEYYDADLNFNSNEPGTSWQYTNAGTGLIGYLAEVIKDNITGEGLLFYEICNNTIFQPLDMPETAWFLRYLNISNIAVPYLWNGSSEEYEPYDHYGRVVYPASGLRSSVTQLRHFLMMMMNDGVYNSTQILEESTIDLMLTVHWGGFMGLIWWRDTSSGRTLWYHQGSTQGCRTVIAFEPATNIGVIVLTNSAHNVVDDIAVKLFDFADNDPPYEPSEPDPDDEETDVSIFKTLSWSGGDPNDDSITYDVYFEADDSTPDVIVSDNQTDTTYDPGTLEENTEYYWKIVAWDEFTSTSGPIWSFTTGENQPPNEPSNPDPTDGATDVPIKKKLKWDGGDPDENDEVTYDVYFGTDSPPPLVDEDIEQTEYNPGTMELATTYYWQIVSEDIQGLTTDGPIWSFTTEEEPNEPPSAPEIDGPTEGPVETELCWTFHSDDPNGNDVKYNISWGDGEWEETDFYPSCTPVEVCHTYDVKDTYTISVYAEDTKEEKSDTSTLEVKIPRQRSRFAFHPLILKLFERFPIFRNLIGLI
jgi:CubicO group peptidase (beta-lactamase class C family)